MTLIQIAYSIKCSLPKKTIVDQRLLNDYFEAKKYAQLISEMKKHLSIPCRLNVKCLKHAPELVAKIDMPHNFPLYGTKDYEKLVLTMKFNKDLLNNFHAFVLAISHELSHIVLYSLNHPLKRSEVATDITAIWLGFSYFYELGHTIYQKNGLGSSFIKTGYLSFEELIHVLDYLET